MTTVAKRKRETTAFGRRLRELREAAGLTQTQLAERAGMVYQALAKYERGENEPTWPVALRLAEALGVSMDEFKAAAGEVSDDHDEEKPTPKRRKR